MLGNRSTLAVALVLALLAAGCVGVGTTDDEGGVQAQATDDGDGSPGGLAWEEVAFEGRLGAEATACSLVACAGTFTCAPEAFCGTPVRDPRVDRSFEVDHDGPVERVNLTLTWDAVSPVTEELRFGLSWDCDDGCDYEYVEGSAPLALEETDLDVEGDLYTWVWTPDQSPEEDPVVLHVTHDQPFAIEGAVGTAAGPS